MSCYELFNVFPFRVLCIGHANWIENVNYVVWVWRLPHSNRQFFCIVNTRRFLLLYCCFRNKFFSHLFIRAFYSIQWFRFPRYRSNVLFYMWANVKCSKFSHSLRSEYYFPKLKKYLQTLADAYNWQYFRSIIIIASESHSIRLKQRSIRFKWKLKFLYFSLHRSMVEVQSR